MHSTAIGIAIFAGMFLTIFLSFLPLFLSGERGRAAQERPLRAVGLSTG